MLSLYLRRFFFLLFPFLLFRSQVMVIGFRPKAVAAAI